MKLEPVIGLEIHVQLKTESKMFCACPNLFGDIEPNTAICPICLGYPGTLPVPNSKAIFWIQKTGAALNCELAEESKFDRKSYFYPDLPKGYQISQYDQPFCGKGNLEIMIEGKKKTIGITRIHLEEDAAKNIHPAGADYTLVDYNRAGTPLVEIVTEPDIKSPEEAKIFLRELQQIMRALKISDADMEKGQLRCDANISLREIGQTEFNPKTEIKNLNSFRFVERALQYEIKRQQAMWEKGKTPHHATRGWNMDKGVTTEQRTKEEAADYRYFPEPDIPPFIFTASDLEIIRKSIPELPYKKRQRFVDRYALSPDLAKILIDTPDLAYIFEDVVSEIKQLDKERVAISSKQVPSLTRSAANILLRYLKPLMAEKELTYETLKITAENFAEMVVLVEEGKLSKSAISQMLAEMQRTGGDPDHILENLGLKQVSETGELDKYADQVIDENPEVVEKIKQGKEAAIQFLMGQVMAKSRGKANPGVIIGILRKKILGEQEK